MADAADRDPEARPPASGRRRTLDLTAQALDLLGDRWTLLIVRDVTEGHRRFGQLQRDLGIARSVLSHRLRRLVDAGIIERRRYHEDPDWFEYSVTGRGRDLSPVIAGLARWAQMHIAGPPEGAVEG